MKNRKTGLLVTAFLCAVIISACAFAMLAAADSDSGAQPEPENPELRSRPFGPKEFRDFKDFEGFEGFEDFKDFEFPEGFEIPEGAERHEFKFKVDGDNPGGHFGFGFGIGGIKGIFGSDGVDIAGILGLTEEELCEKIREAAGNIFKILDEAGKLDEYKDKLMQNFKAKLDEQVAAGAITQEKADEALAMLEESLNGLLSGENAMGMEKMPGRGPRAYPRDQKTETRATAANLSL